MDSFTFKEVLDNMVIDDIIHARIEWQDHDYLKVFEHHQIKANKEEQ